MPEAILAFWNAIHKDLNYGDIELVEAEYAITDGAEPADNDIPFLVDLTDEWRPEMAQVLEAAGATDGSIKDWLRFFRGDDISELVTGNEDLWQLFIRVKSSDGLWSKWSHSIDKGHRPAAPGPIEIIRIEVAETTPEPEPPPPEPEPEPPPPEPEPSTGWTIFSPQPGARIIHVSRLGSNTNDGSIGHPVKTIAEGKSRLRSGQPDWLLLHAGEEFPESLGRWTASGPSPAAPMLIGRYGEGPRPVLLCGSGVGLNTIDGAVNNLAILGLDFYAHTRDPSNAAHTGSAGRKGIHWLAGGDSLLVEDCRFRFFETNIILQAYSGPITNARVRRCVIVDAYASDKHSQGMFLSGVEGVLLEECILDHNGYRPGIANPTKFNHNIYVNPTNAAVVIRRCITARAASHGVSLRPGGDLIENLALENAINLELGQWQNQNAITGSIQRNVCLDAHDIDGEARGFGISTHHGGALNSLLIAGNICSHQRKGTANSIAFQLAGQGGSTGATVQDNIAWAWDGPTDGIGGVAFRMPYGGNTGLVIRRNTWRSFSTNDLIRASSSAAVQAASWSENRYQRPAPEEWFRVGTQRLNKSDWQALTGEPVLQPAVYPDPERTIGIYTDEILGAAPTLEAFLAGAREQRKGAWDQKYTAPAVIDWIRAGFGLEST